MNNPFKREAQVKPWSAMRIVLVIAISVIVSEMISHLIAHSEVIYFGQYEVLVDTTLLLIFLWPSLYFFVFRPITNFAENQALTENELRVII